ncbi:DUF3013 family protein [Dellaglioa sp. BT-FLS60]
MAQETLFDYLKKELPSIDFDGDIVLDWQKKEHTFTVDLTFYAENKSQQAILDIEGVNSELPIISFGDAILLYDEERFDPKEVESDYLTTLPFQGKSGWERSEGSAFINYLQIVLDNGQSDLLDFLNDDDANFFELDWSTSDFEKIQKAQSTQKSMRLVYPKF